MSTEVKKHHSGRTQANRLMLLAQRPSTRQTVEVGDPGGQDSNSQQPGESLCPRRTPLAVETHSNLIPPWKLLPRFLFLYQAIQSPAAACEFRPCVWATVQTLLKGKPKRLPRPLVFLGSGPPRFSQAFPAGSGGAAAGIVLRRRKGWTWASCSSFPFCEGPGPRHGVS